MSILNQIINDKFRKQLSHKIPLTRFRKSFLIRTRRLIFKFASWHFKSRVVNTGAAIASPIGFFAFASDGGRMT